jgi:hypothetical protein
MTNKFISFSLYGNDPKYVIGAYKNIELCQKLCPEWTVKIFTNVNVTSKQTIDILSKFSNTIIIDPETILTNHDVYKFPMFWRFFAFFDNAPALSRDLDSRITVRELQYINNWINLDKSIFIVRDHPWQSQVPGGLVGMKNLGPSFRSFFIDFIQNNSTDWGQDQVMLNSFVSLYNISYIYKCEQNSNSYIPRDNKSFFIGIQLDENDNPICPASLQYLLDLNL